MGRGVNVGSNIWVQILALPHTDCVALGPSLNFVFLCVENGDSAIAAAADLGRVFVRTVKGAYPQWVPRLLGMSSLAARLHCLQAPAASQGCQARAANTNSHMFLLLTGGQKGQE